MSGKHLNYVLPGANLTNCIKAAHELGIKVMPVRGTGEIRFAYPTIGRSVRVNNRRKDAPLALVKFINEIWTAQQRVGRVEQGEPDPVSSKFQQA